MSNTIIGLVINAKSSFFYCEFNDEIYECRASKKLKLNKKAIITGDYVEFDLETKYITKVMKRENELIRPKIANIENAILIFSAIEPSLNTFMIDKMLLLVEASRINAVIVITKYDLLDDKNKKEIDIIVEYYRKIGYDVIIKNTEINNFKKLLIDKSVFMGQSGVGKSTLINELIPNLNLKTQEISKALNRGKHTTRELTFYDYNDGYIIDTPGFSAFDIELSKEEIRDGYVEFYELSHGCKFNGCYHHKEPSCEVKNNLKNDKIYDQRYENYIKNLLEENK